MSFHLLSLSYLSQTYLALCVALIASVTSLAPCVALFATVLCALRCLPLCCVRSGHALIGDSSDGHQAAARHLPRAQT